MRKYILSILLIGFWSCEENEEQNFSITGGNWIQSEYTVDGNNWISFELGTSGALLSYQFASNGNYIISGGDISETLSRYYQYCESENVFQTGIVNNLDFDGNCICSPEQQLDLNYRAYLSYKLENEGENTMYWWECDSIGLSGRKFIRQ